MLSAVEGTSALYPDSTLKAGLLPFKDAKADETFYADISDMINAEYDTVYLFRMGKYDCKYRNKNAGIHAGSGINIKDVADQLDEDQNSVVNN